MFFSFSSTLFLSLSPSLPLFLSLPVFLSLSPSLLLFLSLNPLQEIPQRYHSAFPLDDYEAVHGAGGSFGYPSALYKVTDKLDNQIYALRRFDGLRTNTTVIKSASDKWLSIRHPSIVSLYSITSDKGAVFFAHAYHSTAASLRKRFVDQRGIAILLAYSKHTPIITLTTLRSFPNHILMVLLSYSISPAMLGP